MSNQWPDIEIRERDRFLGIYENDREGIKEVYAGLGLKMSLLSFERKLREHRNYRDQYLRNTAAQIQIPRSQSRRWVDFEVINGDDAIIIGDVEVPDHRAEILKLALLAGMTRNIKRLIINGDLIATDQTALNAWVSTWKVDGELNYESSIDEVVKILRELAAWFTEIIIIEGNHDDRIARKTGGEVYLGMFIPNDLARYSRYSYMYMRTSKRGLIKIVHPENFSHTPVSLGQNFYDVERGPKFDWRNPFTSMEKCHFVIAHTHIDQAGYTKDGVYEVHAVGTCREDSATAYTKKGQNKHHQWSPSFLVIQNGHFTHMHLWGTDWKRELGDLYPSEIFLGAA